MDLLYLENVYICKSLYDRWYIFYLQPSESQPFFFYFFKYQRGNVSSFRLKNNVEFLYFSPGTPVGTAATFICSSVGIH